MELAAGKVARSLGDKRRHLFYDKLLPIREELYKEYLERNPDMKLKNLV